MQSVRNISELNNRIFLFDVNFGKVAVMKFLLYLKIRHALCNNSKFVYCIMNWQDYIISDNQILLGKPTIKGTRISVELVLELFAAGWTEKQILESYPTVSVESLRAVFYYLSVCI